MGSPSRAKEEEEGVTREKKQGKKEEDLGIQKKNSGPIKSEHHHDLPTPSPPLQLLAERVLLWDLWRLWLSLSSSLTDSNSDKNLLRLIPSSAVTWVGGS
ncbi:hypothetical protein K1719_016970 [Acacia pycnantha]|nr:hypothetical protein K1719_016970 [Acacia pycnantha]